MVKSALESAVESAVKSAIKSINSENSVTRHVRLKSVVDVHRKSLVRRVRAIVARQVRLYALVNKVSFHIKYILKMTDIYIYE